MEKATHILFGTILGFILYYNGLKPEYAFISALSAIIPDIDWLIDKVWISRKSILRKWWKNMFGGRGFHRTILHNLWALLAINIAILIYTNYNIFLIIGFTVGFISHLALDSLTKTGIYWLWPYGDEKVTGSTRIHVKWRIRTGGVGERITQLMLVIALFITLYLYDPSIYRTISDWLERLNLMP